MISIILPAYNAEKTIARTLDSCFRQSFQDFEIIAVDDQSTDKTSEIIKDFVRHGKIVYLNTSDIKQKGIVAALNYGISKSNGEYIARIDSDDIMLPQRLEIQFSEFLKNKDLLLCSSDAYLIDENNNQLNGGLSSADNIEELDFKCCIIHPSVMFKKQFFVDNNLSYSKEFEYAEDYDLWMQLRQKAFGNYYKHITMPLIQYRVSGKDRISANHSDEQKEKSRLIRQKYKVKPYLSIVNFGDKNKLQKELSLRDFNYEIISENDKPQGKYIAYSKYDNEPTRFETQVQILNKNKNLVGCGTFISMEKNSFFYSPDPDIIENELLKGKIAIEQNTFLFRNILNDYKHNDYFGLLCNLLRYGVFTNIQQPLVKIENYTAITNTDLTNKSKRARAAYSDVINIIHLNITSEGNFSGVDRYLKTLEENYPSNVRCRRITLKASGDKLYFDLSDRNHVIIYYNPDRTKLEHLYDIIWDNVGYMFANKRNLIVQSNCFNLYTMITWLRQKVALKHICMVHCVPYREVIRHNRDEYAKLEAAFLDETKEFVETQWHYDAVNLADYVILNTKDAENYYNRVGYHAPYSVIFNGIEEIGKGTRKYKEGETFRFIFVGHSSPLKGFNQLLPIIEEVSKKHSIEVHWAGSADPGMVNLIKQKNLPIKIYGVLPPEELNKLYQQVDCALIATACETCSYAAIEALSAGLPIIATRAHGVTEIVENVGLLVDMNIRAELNKDMYKDAMIKVITDESLRDKMSERALNKWSLYDRDTLVKNLVELYSNIL